jgi:hypothetical protein
MGMTSQGQMALRRRALCPLAETRSVVMGCNLPVHYGSSNGSGPDLAKPGWTVA